MGDRPPQAPHSAGRLLLRVLLCLTAALGGPVAVATGAPAVLRSNPLPAAVGVAPDLAIEIFLGEDPGFAPIRLEGAISGPQLGQVTYDETLRALTIYPARPFQPGEAVRLSIGRGESFPGSTLSFRVAASAGSARFEAHDRLTVGSGPNMLAAADLDRDGDADLVASDLLSKHGIHIFLNNGFGRFAALEPLTISGLVDPARFALGDLDRDGNLDLILVGEGSANLIVCKGRGNGRFEPPLKRALETRTPVQAVVGDLNLDGYDDVIVAHLSNSDRLTVLGGEAGGMLGRERRVRAGRGIQSLVVEDLDADGDLDVAAANEEADAVIVLRNLGDGRLEPAAAPVVGGRPQAIVAGDLDRDGTVDLVTVNQGTNNVSVLLGRESLAYAPEVSFAAGERPVIPALADLDGDRDLDLAVPGLFSDEVTVLLNRGDGMFTAGARLPVDSGPVAVAAADFDGDGALDLAVANSVGDDVQVLRNTPAPVETVPADFQAPGLAQNIPNPFNPATEIPYDLADPGHVKLVVFNTSGKMVRTLVERFEAAGPHVATWDGTSDEGDKLPSGIYFYRLTTDETVELRRMTLIR